MQAKINGLKHFGVYYNCASTVALTVNLTQQQQSTNLPLVIQRCLPRRKGLHNVVMLRWRARCWTHKIYRPIRALGLLLLLMLLRINRLRDVTERCVALNALKCMRLEVYGTAIRSQHRVNCEQTRKTDRRKQIGR